MKKYIHDCLNAASSIFMYAIIAKFFDWYPLQNDDYSILAICYVMMLIGMLLTREHV